MWGHMGAAGCQVLIVNSPHPCQVAASLTMRVHGIGNSEGEFRNVGEKETN